jgi:hypothetical protein
MVKFYSQFDHIILLSVSVPIIAERLAGRRNNPYGKRPEELDRVLEHKRIVEPKLRRAAGHEIDTSAPLGEVVGNVLELLDLPERSVATGQP